MSEIDWPIRHLLRKRKEIVTLPAAVHGVDTDPKGVLLDDGSTIPYDTLVLATAARHAYFSHDDWKSFASGLKTPEDATPIRRRILLAFERAERKNDSKRRAALLTFVIIGAGRLTLSSQAPSPNWRAQRSSVISAVSKANGVKLLKIVYIAKPKV